MIREVSSGAASAVLALVVVGVAKSVWRRRGRHDGLSPWRELDRIQRAENRAEELRRGWNRVVMTPRR